MPARMTRCAILRRTGIPPARLTMAAGPTLVAAVGTIAEKLLAAAVLARPEAVLAASWLANSEVGGRTRWRRLSTHSRQRGANERAVDRTLFLGPLLTVVDRFAVQRVFTFGRRSFLRDQVALLRLGGVFSHAIVIREGVRVLLWRAGHLYRVGRAVGLMRHAFGPGRGLRSKRGRGVLFAPLPRHLCMFVFVFGVAGRATGLFDVGTDHRDNGMVGDATLAWTVVVQDVTKP